MGVARVSRHQGFRAFGNKGLTPAQQQAMTAVSLMIAFHIECERYDRTVCNGVQATDGSGVMPRTAAEMGVITRHAEAMADVVRARARRLGVPLEVLEGAQQFVERMPYAQVEADYQRAIGIIGGPLK